MIDTSRPVAIIFPDQYEIEYDSLGVLASSLGIKSDQIHLAIKNDQCIKGHNVKVRYTDSMPADWVSKVTMKSKGTWRIDNSKAVIVTHPDNKEERFGSVSACSRALHMGYDTITKLIKSGVPAKNGLCLRYEGE